jgi:hypothetical protein
MNETSSNWDLEAAETAYTVIASYVEHTQISGIIIALLASHIGEERLKPLVESEHWKNFMASKRDLEAAQKDIQTLTKMIEEMREKRIDHGSDG